MLGSPHGVFREVSKRNFSQTWIYEPMKIVRKRGIETRGDTAGSIFHLIPSTVLRLRRPLPRFWERFAMDGHLKGL